MSRLIQQLVYIAVGFGALMSGCAELSGQQETSSLSLSDRKQIKRMIAVYRIGWLKGDRRKVLNLFTDDATLIPSGLRPINGKNAMIHFWWPQDGAITSIQRYDIRILRIDGDNRNAFSLENGKLSWSYQKGTVSFSKNQESYEVTSFRKDDSGQWHIVQRIWTDVKG